MTDAPEKIRCDACPVLCFIAEGRSGACDRYANHNGELVRLDPLTVIAGGSPPAPPAPAEPPGGGELASGTVLRLAVVPAAEA